MTKTIPLYNATVGVNNRSAPSRLLTGTKRAPGLVELAQGSNVYVDDDGLIRRRKGRVQLAGGVFHSVFCDGMGDGFLIEDRTSDAAIMQIVPVSASSVSLAGIRSGLTKGTRMAWQQVNSDTFYANGTENGYIRDGVSYAWPVGTYAGADTDLQFGPAPVGHHLAFKPGGTMFIARDNAVYANHKPFEFGLYNFKSGAIGFSSKVLMVCAVESGLFVSDQSKTWFFRGDGVFNFSQKKVADYPAIEWSLATETVKASDIGLEGESNVRIWTSPEGVCAGLADGTMLNLTDKKIKLGRSYSAGASIVCARHEACANQVITSLFA